MAYLPAPIIGPIVAADGNLANNAVFSWSAPSGVTFTTYIVDFEYLADPVTQTYKTLGYFGYGPLVTQESSITIPLLNDDPFNIPFPYKLLNNTDIRLVVIGFSEFNDDIQQKSKIVFKPNVIQAPTLPTLELTTSPNGSTVVIQNSIIPDNASVVIKSGNTTLSSTSDYTTLSEEATTRYTMASPGQYTLEVRYGNADGLVLASSEFYISGVDTTAKPALPAVHYLTAGSNKCGVELSWSSYSPPEGANVTFEVFAKENRVVADGFFLPMLIFSGITGTQVFLPIQDDDNLVADALVAGKEYVFQICAVDSTATYLNSIAATSVVATPTNDFTTTFSESMSKIGGGNNLSGDFSMRWNAGSSDVVNYIVSIPNPVNGGAAIASVTLPASAITHTFSQSDGLLPNTSYNPMIQQVISLPGFTGYPNGLKFTCPGIRAFTNPTSVSVISSGAFMGGGILEVSWSNATTVPPLSHTIAWTSDAGTSGVQNFSYSAGDNLSLQLTGLTRFKPDGVTQIQYSVSLSTVYTEDVETPYVTAPGTYTVGLQKDGPIIYTDSTKTVVNNVGNVAVNAEGVPETVTIPATVTRIKTSAFTYSNCKNIIILAEGVAFGGGSFAGPVLNPNITDYNITFSGYFGCEEKSFSNGDGNLNIPPTFVSQSGEGFMIRANGWNGSINGQKRSEKFFGETVTSVIPLPFGAACVWTMSNPGNPRNSTVTILAAQASTATPVQQNIPLAFYDDNSVPERGAGIQNQPQGPGPNVLISQNQYFTIMPIQDDNQTIQDGLNAGQSYFFAPFVASDSNGMSGGNYTQIESMSSGVSISGLGAAPNENGDMVITWSDSALQYIDSMGSGVQGASYTLQITGVVPGGQGGQGGQGGGESGNYNPEGGGTGTEGGGGGTKDGGGGGSTPGYSATISGLTGLSYTLSNFNDIIPGAVYTCNITTAVYTVTSTNPFATSTAPLTFTTYPELTPAVLQFPDPPPPGLVQLTNVTAAYVSSNIEITLVDDVNTVIPEATIQYAVEVVDEQGVTLLSSPASTDLVRSFSAFQGASNTLVSGQLVVTVTVSDGIRTSASGPIDASITGTPPQPAVELQPVSNIIAEHVFGGIWIHWDDDVNTPAGGIDYTVKFDLNDKSIDVPSQTTQNKGTVFPSRDMNGNGYDLSSGLLNVTVTASEGSRTPALATVAGIIVSGTSGIPTPTLTLDSAPDLLNYQITDLNDTSIVDRTFTLIGRVPYSPRVSFYQESSGMNDSSGSLAAPNDLFYSGNFNTLYGVNFDDTAGGIGLTYSSRTTITLPGLSTSFGMYTRGDDVSLNTKAYYSVDSIRVDWVGCGAESYMITLLSDLITGFDHLPSGIAVPIYGNVHVMKKAMPFQEMTANFANLPALGTNASYELDDGQHPTNPEQRIINYSVSVVPIWESQAKYALGDRSINQIKLSPPVRDGVYFTDSSYQIVNGCDPTYNFAGPDGPNLKGVVKIMNSSFANNNTINSVKFDQTLRELGDPLFAANTDISFSFSGPIPLMDPTALEGIGFGSVIVPENVGDTIEWAQLLEAAGLTGITAAALTTQPPVLMYGLTGSFDNPSTAVMFSWEDTAAHYNPPSESGYTNVQFNFSIEEVNPAGETADFGGQTGFTGMSYELTGVDWHNNYIMTITQASYSDFTYIDGTTGAINYVITQPLTIAVPSTPPTPFPVVQNVVVTPVEAGVHLSWQAPDMGTSTEALTGYIVGASLVPFTGANFEDVILLPSEGNILNPGVDITPLDPSVTTATFRVLDDTATALGALTPGQSYYFCVVSVGSNSSRLGITVSELASAGPVVGATISGVSVLGNSLKVEFTPLADSTHTVTYVDSNGVEGTLGSDYMLNAYTPDVTYTFSLNTVRSIIFTDYDPAVPYAFTAPQATFQYSVGGGGGTGQTGNSGGTGHNNMSANLQFSLVLSNDASQASIFHVAGETVADVAADATAQLTVPIATFNKLLVFANDWDMSLTGSEAGESGASSANANGQPLVALRLDLVKSKLNEFSTSLTAPLDGRAPSSMTFKDDANADVPALAKWFGEYSSIDGMSFTNSVLDTGILENGAVARITQGDVSGPALGDVIGIPYDSTGITAAGGETALYSLFEQAMAAGKVLGTSGSSASDYAAPAAWGAHDKREAKFTGGDQITLYVQYNLTKKREYVVDTDLVSPGGTAAQNISFMIGGVSYEIPLEAPEESGVGHKTYKVVLTASD